MSVEIAAKNYSFQAPNYVPMDEVGCCSMDADHKMHMDKRNLRFFRSPPKWEKLNFDLDLGFEDWIRPDELKSLGFLLEWLHLEKERKGYANYKAAAGNADVVCKRGVLAKIGNVPYQRQDDLKIAVMRCHDLIFLHEFDSDFKLELDRNKTDNDWLMCYRGIKFESFVTANSPKAQPDAESPINGNKGFYSVGKAKLGDHAILCAAEVDCVDVKRNKYVELKTTPIFNTQKQEDEFYRFKSQYWWLQSFFIGIEDIVVGFKDKRGRVKRMERMKTSVLAEDPRMNWSPDVCLNFLDAVLSCVKEEMWENSAKGVKLLEWRRGTAAVQLRPLLQLDALEYDFLPLWFTSD